MSADPPAVRPGDVLVVRSGGLAGTMIRLGAALRNAPNLSNHVAVAHHVDAHGTLWCAEGKPGGAGQRDARAYLASPWTLTNAAQPKTQAQRDTIVEVMTALNGTAYDWQAITASAARDLGFRLPGWDPDWRGQVPVHVICSSLAAYAYAKAGLPCPPGERGTQPSDWDAWILTRAWEKPPGLLYRGRRFNGPLRATLKAPRHRSFTGGWRGAFSRAVTAATSTDGTQPA